MLYKLQKLIRKHKFLFKFYLLKALIYINFKNNHKNLSRTKWSEVEKF